MTSPIKDEFSDFPFPEDARKQHTLIDKDGKAFVGNTIEIADYIGMQLGLPGFGASVIRGSDGRIVKGVVPPDNCLYLGKMCSKVGGKHLSNLAIVGCPYRRPALLRSSAS